MRNRESKKKSKAADSISQARKTRWWHVAVLGTVSALVIGVYVHCAKSGALELLGYGAEGSYYNLLVEGFRDGHLYLKKDPPPAFARLTNPYDPTLSSPFRMLPPPLHDLSYYHGRFYLYFGVTPAAVLFWPYATATGHYLLHRDAALIFFSVGFLAGAGLLWSMWRRYFAGTPFWLVIAGVLAIGLANFAPAILARSDVYEVAIGCGYAMTMLSLLGVWGALHASKRPWLWLALASLAYGLALGARPSLLFGAVILLVPLVQALRIADCGLRIGKADGAEGSGSEIRNAQSAIRNVRAIWPLLLAAIVPVALTGAALLAYNSARFGDPFEFGQRYQTPSPTALGAKQQFGLEFLWFNFRVGFLAPARWAGEFPFVRDIAVPALPKGYWEVQNAFGVLTNIPLVWLALAAPLAWRGKLGAIDSTLRWFLGAVLLIFAACAVTLGLHDSMCLRYEVEFTQPLVLLAVAGIFGLERAAAVWPTVRRRAVRCGWVLLLAFSIAFNLLAGAARGQDYEVDRASALFKKGNPEEAVPWFNKALRARPNHIQANLELGNILVHSDRLEEGIARYRTILKVKPDHIDARINLGIALHTKGATEESRACFEKLLEIQPESSEAQYNLGILAFEKGDVDGAIDRYEKAVKAMPYFQPAHHNLGVLLLQRGNVDEAILHFEKVIEIQPDDLNAYVNLGDALRLSGRLREAAAVFERALKIEPANLDIRGRLALLLATCTDDSVRNGARALELAREANRLSGGNNWPVQSTLAAAYAETGQFPEAIAAIQQAMKLATGENASDAVTQELQRQLELYKSGTPARDLR